MRSNFLFRQFQLALCLALLCVGSACGARDSSDTVRSLILERPSCCYQIKVPSKFVLIGLNGESQDGAHSTFCWTISRSRRPKTEASSGWLDVQISKSTGSTLKNLSGYSALKFLEDWQKELKEHNRVCTVKGPGEVQEWLANYKFGAPKQVNADSLLFLQSDYEALFALVKGPTDPALLPERGFLMVSYDPVSGEEVSFKATGTEEDLLELQSIALSIRRSN